MQVSEIAEKLVRQKQRGQSTILFLGAGASVTANIPTTRGIVQYINESSEFDHIENQETPNYFDIMGQLESGERKKLLSHFINRAKINETHFIAGQLLRLGYIDCIITTNFDPLIENSAKLFNTNYKTFDVANNVSLTGHSITFPSIIYLHGEYRNVWQLNTNDELKENINNISSVISNIASKESTWLIVGYSGNDIVFDELAKVEVFNHGLYWIGYKQQSPIKKVQKQLLSKSTKNAYLVNGYTADTFFKKLFDEIIKQGEHNEISLGNSLNTILMQRKHQNQLDSTQGINTANQIPLTIECKEWVKQKADSLTSIDKDGNLKEERFLTNLVRQIFDQISRDSERISEIKTYIENGLFREALKSSDEEIEENSENPLGYYYKGVALAEIAGSLENPAERKEYYKRMNFAFKEAREFAVKSDKEYAKISRIQAIKNVVWQTEHNRAILLARDNKLKEKIPKPLKKSIQHLQNAILVKPASTLSWDVLSQVAAMNTDFEESARAKKQYLNMMPNTKKETNDFIQLAQCYYKLDDQEGVLKTLQEAQELYPTDEQIVSNLADTYTRMGQPEKAISTVEALVKQNPDNPQYWLSYGTQIYQKALTLRDSVTANNKGILSLRQKLQNTSGSASQKLKQQISQLQEKNEEMQPQIEKLTNQAEQEVNKSLELRPDDAAANNVLGAIYQNRAKDVFDERNRTTEDHEKADKLDKQGKDLLRTAVKYYEQAAQIDPENQSYWRSLFQIYTALDMDDEAQKAKEKAGI